ncbi:MAG: hypothetical protein ACXV3A_01015 [Kineosporiaceae bacterium]
MGLPPVADVRSHVFTDGPWLAADPARAPWDGSPDGSEVAVFQTGAWILEDERPLPPDPQAFLDAGEPPVYVGFGSVRAPQGFTTAVIQTVRALGAARSSDAAGPSCP